MSRSVPSRDITRREFAKLAGTAVAVTAVASATGGCVGGADSEPVETPSYSFGKDTSVESAPGKRILVTYATGKGSTVGVAEAIGKTLGERGFAVDVKPAKEKPSPAGYDAVVIGSAVNGGQWLPEAVEYAKTNARALAGMPVALFCVHAMNVGDSEKSRTKRLAYLDAVREVVKPCGEGFFAGVMELSGLGGWVWGTFDLGVEGDARDWDAIAAWARELELGAPA